MQVSMGLGTAHLTKVARGLPTSSVNVNDKISDVLNMSIATKTGVLMTGDMYDIVDGLGTAINQPKGLAIIAEGKNTGCMIMPNTEIGPSGVRALPLAAGINVGGNYK